MEANRDYWEGRETGYSDSEYAAMCTRLRSSRPGSPALIEIGLAPREGSFTVEHPRPMQSLRKADNLATLIKWADGASDRYYITPKVDGVAVRLVFGPEGELQFAVTRGNGKVGELVTKAIRAAGLDDLNAPRNSELIGELYINRKDFQRYSDRGMACARNVVAGFLKQKHPEDNFPLRFYLYGAIRDGQPLETELQKLHLCETLELNAHAVATSRPSDFEDIIRMMEFERRPDWPFETDGLVFRVGTQEEFDALGTTGHHPKGAIAYKFDDETAITVVRSLTSDVSRTGVITPVAEFDPVNLAGASLGSATLHHWGRQHALKLRPGSKIRVARRGAVIPHVEGVVENPNGVGPFQHPKECPSCGGPTEIRAGDKPEVRMLHCIDAAECPGVLIGRIQHYASVTGIKGFGPSMTMSLMLQGRLEGLTSIYDLRPQSGDWKGIDNLCGEIERARVLEPAVFLAALGVAHVGKETAEALCRAHPLSGILVSPHTLDFADIQGIGDVVAESIKEELERHKLEFLAVSRCVHLKKRKVTVKGGKWPNTPFAGACVLFTGVIPGMPREVAEERVRKLGGYIGRSATKSLDILVSTTPGSTKHRKTEEWIARGRTIIIMSDTEFKEALIPC